MGTAANISPLYDLLFPMQFRQLVEVVTRLLKVTAESPVIRLGDGNQRL